MSGFAVFGHSVHRAREMAQRKVRTTRFDKELNEQVPLTLDEITRAIATITEEIFSSSRESQISPAFDAPQFCHEWIKVAGDSVRVSSIKQRVNETGDKPWWMDPKYHWETMP